MYCSDGLKLCRKWSRSCSECYQYHTRSSWLACADMKFCNVTDMYTFATVGENDAN